MERFVFTLYCFGIHCSQPCRDWDFDMRAKTVYSFSCPYGRTRQGLIDAPTVPKRQRHLQKQIYSLLYPGIEASKAIRVSVCCSGIPGWGVYQVVLSSR